jgi:hypothetical protein
MVNALKIEKGVPMVPAHASYRFLDTLQPGDSVLVGLDTNINSVLASARYRQERYGKKFCRQTVEGQGWRIWRTK